MRSIHITIPRTSKPLYIRSHSHFIGLDAMRGIAAIAVVVLHIGQRLHLGNLAPYGMYAVDLFFVVSGFVIGRAYESKMSTAAGLRRFFLLRVARLLPALLLGAVVGFIAYGLSQPTPATFAMLLMTIVLVPTLGPNLFPLNGPFWSLFYEVIANVVHAVTFRVLSIAILFAFVGLMAIVYIVAAYRAGSTSLGTQDVHLWSGFARVGWGYGAGLMIHRLRLDDWTFVPSFPIIVPVLLISPILFLPRLLPASLHAGLCIFVVLPAAVILAIRARQTTSLARAYRFLGDISYPLYTVHSPILMMIGFYFGALLTPLATLFILLALILLAAVIERVYDKPMREYLKSFIRQSGRSGEARATSSD